MQSKKLTAEELKLHTLRAEHYSLKEFFAVAGLSWQPSNKTIARVANKPLLSATFQKFSTIIEAENFWQDVFDPFSTFKRSEFVVLQNQLKQLLFNK